MISIDTNIIIRFLVKDDKAQFGKAYRLISAHEVYVSDTVVLETEWVLRYAYGFDSAKICEALEGFFGLPNVMLSKAQIVFDALQWCRKGMDFDDALHLSLSQSIEQFATFDKKLIKKSKLLKTKTKVVEP